MKTNFKSILIASVLLIGVVAMAIGYIRTTISKNSPRTEPHGWTINNIEPIDKLNASDSLPYVQYKNLLDSMKSMRALKNGDAFVTNKGSFAYLGTQFGIACDTCSYKWYREQALKAAMIALALGTYTNDKDEHAQNYIKLIGWTIKKKVNYVNEDGMFYVKNGQGYVRTTSFDTSKDGLASHKINIFDVPVKFRYNVEDKSVLIPVSAGEAKLFRSLTTTLLWLYIAGILFLLYLFLRFIYDTSKGKSFTDKNVSRLKIIAFIITFYPMLVILVNWLMKFIFHKYFIDELVLKNVVWTDSWKTLEIGILLLMLYAAFSRGKPLQEEQDLTV